MQLAEAYVQERVRHGEDWTAALPLLQRLHDSLHSILLPNVTLDDFWWSPPVIQPDKPEVQIAVNVLGQFKRYADTAFGTFASLLAAPRSCRVRVHVLCDAEGEDSVRELLRRVETRSWGPSLLAHAQFVFHRLWEDPRYQAVLDSFPQDCVQTKR